MKRYRIALAYEGTYFSGWQKQPNGLSIQTLVEKALTTILRTPAYLTASGRTDRGVHALEQIAHFTVPITIDTARLIYSANALLPKDIRLLECIEVDLSFHARYSALSKEYHYYLISLPHLSPFRRNFALHFPYSLDLSLMRSATLHFVGTRDFTSFANEAARGSAAKNAVRTLKRIDLFEEEEGIRLEFEGDGFLYKMVRNIVGTLLEVGRHKLSLEEIPSIFRAKDRRRAPNAAPPQGLFLVKVYYTGDTGNLYQFELEPVYTSNEGK